MSSIHYVCAVENCDKKRVGKGYCNTHYRRYRRHGDPLAPKTYGRTHNLSRSIEYRVWASMKSRCYYKKYIGYKNYGGRGITVCDSWLNSFDNFLADMGTRPSSKHSIDRIDNDGNYEPSNCRWTVKEIQGFNQRNPKLTKSGYRGVYLNSRGTRWLAYTQHKYIGSYNTAEEASQAYEKVRAKRIQELLSR